MATVDGPFPEDTVRAHTVDLLIVNELEMAEYYCKFICHESNHNDMYNLRTYIDVLNNEERPKRVFSNLKNLNQEIHYNFSITNIEISSCNATNNVTIYKTQIIFLSVNSNTPTLIARCIIEYKGIPATGCTNRLCSSPSTFAIIPNITTVTGTETPALERTELPRSGIPPQQFAPVTAILGLIVLIETILLTICFFVRYKKSHNRVSALNHKHDHSEKDSNMAGSGDRTMLTKFGRV